MARVTISNFNFALFCLAFCFIFFTCHVPTANGLASRYRLELWNTYVGTPAGSVAFDGHLYMLEYTGLITRFENGNLVTVGDLTDRVISDPVTAFGASWMVPFPSENAQWIFVSYFSENDLRFSRFDFNGSHLDRNTEYVVASTPYFTLNHPGGAMLIVQDEYNEVLDQNVDALYMGVGTTEVTGGEVINPYPIYNLTGYHGKILKVLLHRNNGTFYYDPSLSYSENPLLHSYGVRNPYIFTKDNNNTILCTDPGQENYETVRRLTKGKNYGYPRIEGYQSMFSVQDADQTIPDDFVQPQFGFSAQEECAVTGGLFYLPKHHMEFPELYNKWLGLKFGCINTKGFRGDMIFFPATSDKALVSDWVPDDAFRELNPNARSVHRNGNTKVRHRNMLSQVKSIKPENLRDFANEQWESFQQRKGGNSHKRSDFSVPSSNDRWFASLPIENIEELHSRFFINTVLGPNDEILIIGGAIGQPIHIYKLAYANRPAPLNWTLTEPTGTLPQGRVYSRMIHTNKNGQRRLIAFGGQFEDGNYTNEMWKYTFATNTWSALTPSGDVPSGRADHVFLYDEDNHIYLLGGQNLGGYLSDLWKYNIQGNNWTLIASNTVLSGRSRMASVLSGNYIYTFGGTKGDEYFGDLWRYNFQANTWQLLTEGESSPPPRHSSYLMEGVEDGTLLLYGGWGSHWPNLFGFDKKFKFPDLWTYDIGNEEWTMTISPLEGKETMEALTDGIYWRHGRRVYLGLGDGYKGACNVDPTTWLDPTDTIWFTGIPNNENIAIRYQWRNMKFAPQLIGPAFALNQNTVYVAFGMRSATTTDTCLLEYQNDVVYSVPKNLN